MKKESTSLGMNRTGIATSPIEAKRLLEATEQTVPSRSGSAADFLEVRAELSRELGPIGSVPPPATVKGMAKAAVQALKGERATVLIDKLAERLAFERSGVRLYQGLLVKYDVHGSWSGGPSREELVRILTDELAHYKLLTEAVASLGADPTAQTPSADLVAVASKGIIAIITDARTNFREALEAIQIAELVDNACWETLEQLARAMGHVELADRFVGALAEEQLHLVNVRNWLAAGIGVTAKTELEPPAPSPV